MAVCALIFGILGIIGSFIPVVQYFTTILAVLGLILGAVARKKAKAAGQPTGVATAGLVLGIIGTVFAFGGIICAIACAGAIGGLGAMM